MRLARLFSTTFHPAAQPLFKPYVTPLNKEQQKALRRAELKKQPNYHGRLAKDADALLKVFRPLDESRPLHLQRLNQVIKKIAGDDFSVVDVGMSRFAMELYRSPLEFAIVDEKRPNGILPGVKQTDLPLVYDPSHLARQLTVHGFTGSFVNHPIDFDPVPIENFIPPPPRRQLTSPFPDYKRLSEWGVIFPAQLNLESPISCTLTLPGSTSVALYNFIIMCCSMDALRKMISHLYIWTRSLQMYEFTPTCLALMCIRFLQESGHLPDLFDADTIASACKDREKPGVWLLLEYRDPESLKSKNLMWKTEPVWLETSPVQYSGRERRSKRIGALLFSFFSHWSVATTRTNREIVSVRENCYQKRSEKFISARHQRNVDHFIRTTARSLWQAKTLGMQPASWKYQQLVVQDPFVPTYNHAAGVSRASVRYFEYNCALAARSLSHGHPLHSILGAYFLPPRPFRKLALKLDKFGIPLPPRSLPHRSWEQELGESPSPQGKDDVEEPTDEVQDRDRVDVPRVQTPERQDRSMWGSGRKMEDRPQGFGLKLTRRYHTSAVLSEELENLRQFFQPPQRVLDWRAQTIERVRETIHRRYGGGYRVESFGSTRYGVSSPDSDLDLVIIDSKRMGGFEPHVNFDSLPDIYNVRKLASVLRRAGFINIQAIASANVPIVKFRDPVTLLDCDINVNEQLGLMNTMMLSRYCDLSPHLRPLIGLVKTWARPLGLNNPSNDWKTKGVPVTFSSYALTLMCIGFLQDRGLLPNLQEGLQELGESEEAGTFWLVLKGKTRTRLRCDVRYHNAQGWLPPMDVAMEGILVDWFRYWGHEHQYEDTLLDIRLGAFLPRKKREKKKGKGKQITLEVQLPIEIGEEEREVFIDNHGDLAGELWARESKAHSSLQTQHEDHDEYDGSVDGAMDPEELGDPPLRSDEEPPTWIKHSLCVVDPFIRHKNVTQNIGRPSVRRFQLDCQRAAFLLSTGSSLSDVIGDTERHREFAKGKQSQKKWDKGQRWEGQADTVDSHSNATEASRPLPSTSAIKPNVQSASTQE